MQHVSNSLQKTAGLARALFITSLNLCLITAYVQFDERSYIHIEHMCTHVDIYIQHTHLQVFIRVHMCGCVCTFAWFGIFVVGSRRHDGLCGVSGQLWDLCSKCFEHLGGPSSYIPGFPNQPPRPNTTRSLVTPSLASLSVSISLIQAQPKGGSIDQGSWGTHDT